MKMNERHSFKDSKHFEFVSAEYQDNRAHSDHQIWNSVTEKVNFIKLYKLSDANI